MLNASSELAFAWRQAYLGLELMLMEEFFVTCVYVDLVYPVNWLKFVLF
jgi:hypothetical protein